VTPHVHVARQVDCWRRSRPTLSEGPLYQAKSDSEPNAHKLNSKVIGLTAIRKMLQKSLAVSCSLRSRSRGANREPTPQATSGTIAMVNRVSRFTAPW